MTANKWDTGTWGGGPVPDVLVALFPGSSAPAVARAAVREASGRGARVRFIQMLTARESANYARTDPGARPSEEVTFAAALTALREHPRLPVTFETLDDGESTQDRLIERTSSAAVLVLGTGTAREQRLVDHCQRYARCDVLLVRDSLPTAPRQAESVRDIS